MTDDRRIDEIWLGTLGHPLSLSLSLGVASDERRRDGARSASPEECVRRWLSEAPDDELRELLYAASVPRSFHQELLGELIGKPVPDSGFERLVGLSFANRTARGWQLSELVWETLRGVFRERRPARFAEYSERSIAHYARLLEEGVRKRRTGGWEIAQLMRFSSSPVLRAHLRHSRPSRHGLEPVDAANLDAAADYIEARRHSAKPMRIRCSDAETGALFRFELTAEESLLRLSALPLDELARACPGSVQLLRSPEGKTVGLFAIVPIHDGTVPFLRSAPLSRSYFRHLEETGAELPAGDERKPAGWFVYAVDVADLEDEELRADIVGAVFEKIVEGGLVLQSPPPLAYYQHACEGLGFERSAAPSHEVYGERLPAAVYEIDTRGSGLRTYLRKMIPELNEEGREEPAANGAFEKDVAGLTPREKEVAALLTRGLSNAEIATALYVSVAAVKKHINAMLSKYGLKNRTQLAKSHPGRALSLRDRTIKALLFAAQPSSRRAIQDSGQDLDMPARASGKSKARDSPPFRWERAETRADSLPRTGP